MRFRRRSHFGGSDDLVSAVVASRTIAYLIVDLEQALARLY